jgi:hypothetical protein
MNERPPIGALVKSAVSLTPVRGKQGRDLLQGLVANHISQAGLVADLEDQGQFLQSGMPVWRSKDTGQVELTPGRRLTDIVVYDQRKPIALIEIESDLNDLRRTGVTNRNGHYDVHSIARDANGSFFHSYKSLERMAAAAMYHALFTESGAYPTSDQGVSRLQKLASDDPSDHNPMALELILVSGSCRSYDREVLAKRLQSLGAQLICVTQR